MAKRPCTPGNASSCWTAFYVLSPEKGERVVEFKAKFMPTEYFRATSIRKGRKMPTAIFMYCMCSSQIAPCVSSLLPYSSRRWSDDHFMATLLLILTGLLSIQSQLAYNRMAPAASIRRRPHVLSISNRKPAYLGKEPHQNCKKD